MRSEALPMLGVFIVAVVPCFVVKVRSVASSLIAVISGDWWACWFIHYDTRRLAVVGHDRHKRD
jgi:hypothetical protein